MRCIARGRRADLIEAFLIVWLRKRNAYVGRYYVAYSDEKSDRLYMQPGHRSRDRYASGLSFNTVRVATTIRVVFSSPYPRSINPSDCSLFGAACCLSGNVFDTCSRCNRQAGRGRFSVRGSQHGMLVSAIICSASCTCLVSTAAALRSCSTWAPERLA